MPTTRLAVRAAVFCATFVISLFPITLTTQAKEPAVGRPSNLIIRRLRINTPIEPLGILPSGNLDTPKDPLQAGWWKGSAKPGEEGTAVIDGHMNVEGKPAIFYKLDTVRVGDAVIVQGSDGKRRTFIVRETKIYDVETAPLDRIFKGSKDGKYLNLITCAGQWDDALGHYDKRLIVYAEMTGL